MGFFAISVDRDKNKKIAPVTYFLNTNFFFFTPVIQRNILHVYSSIARPYDSDFFFFFYQNFKRTCRIMVVALVRV